MHFTIPHRNAFPVVWLLAEVNMISPALEHISWGVCDWVAKVILNIMP
jgi:hypothetical protein